MTRTRTHTHTKTYAVVSHHMLRRTARRKERKLDGLTKVGNTPLNTTDPHRIAEARAAAKEELRSKGLPTNGEYETRKALRGPWRWQVIVWS